jgi:patatin-like phospholipase/acyl hydrolase
VLDDQEKEIEVINKTLYKNRVIKWVITLAACVVTYFLNEYTIIKAINFFGYSNNQASRLQPFINKWIPENHKIDDILTQELMMPAWDSTNKEPVFFSKFTYQNYSDEDPMYAIPLRDMVWASNTNPSFFGSAKITWPGNDKGNLFFGGDTVATCPALYSHFLMSNFWDMPTSNITMVAVGNKDYNSDKISSTVSVLDWVSRLYTLTGPVKKYTQNYMVEHILRKFNRDWNYFFLPTSNEFSFLEMVSNQKNP